MSPWVFWMTLFFNNLSKPSLLGATSPGPEYLQPPCGDGAFNGSAGRVEDKMSTHLSRDTSVLGRPRVDHWSVRGGVVCGADVCRNEACFAMRGGNPWRKIMRQNFQNMFTPQKIKTHSWPSGVAKHISKKKAVRRLPEEKKKKKTKCGSGRFSKKPTVAFSGIPKDRKTKSSFQVWFPLKQKCFAIPGTLEAFFSQKKSFGASSGSLPGLGSDKKSPGDTLGTQTKNTGKPGKRKIQPEAWRR